MFTRTLFPCTRLLVGATLALGISPVLAQENSSQPAKLQLVADSMTQAPERLDAPFELHNNLIYVTAELNGKAGKFLVDSGAPAFALNADQLNPAQLKDSPVSVKGVGGSLRVKSFHVKSFHVDSFTWKA